jgi:hypothetical protein
VERLKDDKQHGGQEKRHQELRHDLEEDGADQQNDRQQHDERDDARHGKHSIIA